MYLSKALFARKNSFSSIQKEGVGDSQAMKSVLREMVSATSVAEIPFQSASVDIWEKKYRLAAKDGTVIDQTMDETYQRVARALADVEEEDKREEWNERFVWALRNGAIPAGRIMSNAGALAYKPATSTINCTVSGIVGDSMDDILRKVHEAGLTLKAGCGIGYEFSTLRPRGAYVSGAGAYTSGPLSFMDIYDKMCFTVSSAGGRRGAQMGTFDVGHPDALEFIRAKREAGRLRQFNLSLLVTDEWTSEEKYERFKITESGVSPRILLGTKGATFLANGNEHDEYGYTTIDPEKVVAMAEKRFRKRGPLMEEVSGLEPVEVFGDPDPAVTLVGWGSTKGPALEALRMLGARGVKARFVQVVYMEPFPTEELRGLLKGGGETVLFETNMTAQLDKLIRLNTGFAFEHVVLKYDGRPFSPGEICARVEEVI